jgi:hypothetical protein
VDDILKVYNRDTTNIEHLLSEFNDLHPSIHFTIETETDNKLNLLDVSIHRTQSGLQFGIYRKPTATDIMIHSQSCHPRERKWSGSEYLINRLLTYPIVNKQEEKNMIKHLLTANGYHQNILEDILKKTKTGESRGRGHA